MSVTVPSTYTRQRLSRWLAGAPLRAEDWQALIQGANGQYARRGGRVSLVSRAVPWQTASASYTQTDSGAAGVDLDAHAGVLRLVRPLLISASAQHRIVLAVYGVQVEARVTIYAGDTNTTLATVKATQSGASGAWATGEVNLTAAQADAGGTPGAAPRVLYLAVDALATSGTASLYEVHLREVVASAAQMP